jgi:flagella synthesis protein FlgN
MKSSQQALAVLMSASEQASTYGPDGQSMTRSTSRSLGSA